MPDLRKYYRNKAELKGVEPGSLWYKEAGFFILADEDEFITIKAREDDDRFYKVQDPTGK